MEWNNPDLSPKQKKVLLEGQTRNTLLSLIRKPIELETSYQTNMLNKSELAELLVILEEDQ